MQDKKLPENSIHDLAYDLVKALQWSFFAILLSWFIFIITDELWFTGNIWVGSCILKELYTVIWSHQTFCLMNLDAWRYLLNHSKITAPLSKQGIIIQKQCYFCFALLYQLCDFGLARRLKDIEKTNPGDVSFHFLFVQSFLSSCFHIHLIYIPILNFYCLIGATTHEGNTVLYGSWVISRRRSPLICFWFLGTWMCFVWMLYRKAPFCRQRIYTVGQIYNFGSYTTFIW